MENRSSALCRGALRGGHRLEAPPSFFTGQLTPRGQALNPVGALWSSVVSRDLAKELLTIDIALGLANSHSLLHFNFRRFNSTELGRWVT